MPFDVVIVITEVPSAIVVTLPNLGVTVATVGVALAKVTDLSTASSGITVGLNVKVSPSVRDNSAAILIPSGSWGGLGRNFYKVFSCIRCCFVCFRQCPIIKHC